MEGIIRICQGDSVTIVCNTILVIIFQYAVGAVLPVHSDPRSSQNEVLSLAPCILWGHTWFGWSTQ